MLLCRASSFTRFYKPTETLRYDKVHEESKFVPEAPKAIYRSPIPIILVAVSFPISSVFALMPRQWLDKSESHSSYLLRVNMLVNHFHFVLRSTPHSNKDYEVGPFKCI